MPRSSTTSSYVGALRGQRLWRVPLSDGEAGEPEALLQDDYGRLRNVVAGPDGRCGSPPATATAGVQLDDGDDRVLRLDPDSGS